MGVYLNSKSAYGQFRKDRSSVYYVDKTDILAELIPAVEAGSEPDSMDSGSRYIAVTRPRRFGKTVMANMIASYFGKGVDSDKTFQGLKVSQYEWYSRHLNQHNVIHIVFSDMPDDVTSYRQYIDRIKKRLMGDLIKAYPDAGIDKDYAVWDAFQNVYEYCGEESFIFVLDEWDSIFHKDFMSDTDKASYLEFLKNMLKDKPYVDLAYMTGVLPISKYSSGSELNMFVEYSMTSQTRFSEYFGFTDEEVDILYNRYRQIEKLPQITREGLELWYDGYQTASGTKLYNPRSVVVALTNNRLGNYWTSSGPYDEIFYYISANVDMVKDDIALLVADNPVPAKIQEYAAVAMELKTRDEILSAMVVYGFLNYSDGYVSIPNKELMDRFAEVVQREPSMGNVYKLTKESGRMLEATKRGDTDTMQEIMEYAHNTLSPLNVYNNEAELASVVRWVYLKALDSYWIERENKGGLGYADFIFYPFNKADDAIIIELKVDHTADEAIQQVKDRQYALKLAGKFGDKPLYTGRILAVGIAYSKKDKKKRHECKVEVLREKI